MRKPCVVGSAIGHCIVHIICRLKKDPHHLGPYQLWRFCIRARKRIRYDTHAHTRTHTHKLIMIKEVCTLRSKKFQVSTKIWYWRNVCLEACGFRCALRSALGGAFCASAPKGLKLVMNCLLQELRSSSKHQRACKNSGEANHSKEESESLAWWSACCA
jgi:hypothetical protein